MFMSSSVEAAIHLGPSYLAQLEVYKNTNFGEIQSLFNITQKSILGHSEEILNVNTIVHLPHGRDPYCLTIKWSSGQKQKYVFTQIPYDAWGKMNDSKDAIRRWEGQVEEFKMSHSYKELLGIDGEPIELEWNIFPKFASLQILQEIQNDLRKRNTRTWNNSQTGSASCTMFNDIDWTMKKKRWNLYFEFRKKSRKTRRDSRRDIGRFSVLETKSRCYGTLPYTPEGKWDSAAAQMVERFKDTGLVIQYSRVLVLCVVEFWEKKRMTGTPYISMRMLRTPSTCSEAFTSVNQLSIFGAVSNWCEQFGLTWKRIEDPQEKLKESVIKGVLTSVKSQEVQAFGICSKTSIRKLSARKHSGLRIAVRDNSIHNGVRTRHLSGTGFLLAWATKLDLTRTTVLGSSFHYAENTRFFEETHNPEPLQQFLEEPFWTSHWKFLTNMDLKLQFHHPMIDNEHPMLWFPEGRVGSWMKFIFPTPNSDPVQNYALNFRKQEEEVNLAWDSRRLASRRLVRPMFQVRPASRRLVRTPSAFLPAMRPFSHKEPFLRPRWSGQLFLPILRMEELCQLRSPKLLQEWCVITIKMNDNLTQHFTGTR